MADAPLDVLYFSDLLCVWAYAGQVRVDELQERLGDRIRIHHHFMNIYGALDRRVADKAPRAKDPYALYARGLRDVAARFDHTKMHADCFTKVRPASSNQAHLLLRAAGALIADGSVPDPEGTLLDRLVRRVRLAFFEEAEDIGRHDVLVRLLGDEGIPREGLHQKLGDGSAIAELSWDLQQKDALSVPGSPTYVLDGGRQKLFGNVGYRIIEANVAELLDAAKDPRGATWC